MNVLAPIFKHFSSGYDPHVVILHMSGRVEILRETSHKDFKYFVQIATGEWDAKKRKIVSESDCRYAIRAAEEVLDGSLRERLAEVEQWISNTASLLESTRRHVEALRGLQPKYE